MQVDWANINLQKSTTLSTNEVDSLLNCYSATKNPSPFETISQGNSSTFWVVGFLKRIVTLIVVIIIDFNINSPIVCVVSTLTRFQRKGRLGEQNEVNDVS
ncbi:unnamed protein product [Lactuca virosa]|uniref:Uncharacterized protein n=1 Tax=Lactuca virosa TaxID=75947 RepID=A0AAU9MWA8_9ASTR|nr:unnamed protein product [Lactuca virosa]